VKHVPNPNPNPDPNPNLKMWCSSVENVPCREEVSCLSGSVTQHTKGGSFPPCSFQCCFPSNVLMVTVRVRVRFGNRARVRVRIRNRARGRLRNRVRVRAGDGVRVRVGGWG
jgi:hypothetical protein